MALKDFAAWNDDLYTDSGINSECNAKTMEEHPNAPCVDKPEDKPESSCAMKPADDPNAPCGAPNPDSEK